MSPKTTPNAASVNAGRQERLEWLSGSKERRKLLPHRTKCKLDYDGAQCARAQAEQLLPLIGLELVIQPQRERRSPSFRGGLHFQHSEENSQGKRGGHGNDPAPVGAAAGFGMRPLRETELLYRVGALLRSLRGAALRFRRIERLAC